MIIFIMYLVCQPFEGRVAWFYDNLHPPDQETNMLHVATYDQDMLVIQRGWLVL